MYYKYDLIYLRTENYMDVNAKKYPLMWMIQPFLTYYK